MAPTDPIPQPGSRPPSRLRSVLPYTTIAVVIAALYVAWVFYSRHESAAREQAAVQEKQDESRKRVLNQIYGSGEIMFTTFSLSRAVLDRGASAQLCYGVVNATSVKIEPPVGEAVKPTYRHCVEVRPKVTTTYTITAGDAKGGSKTLSITAQVR